MTDEAAPLAGSEEAGASAPADLSPQGMTSTRALRKMLRDWQHRPLLPSELAWAESWLDIIDITHELQSQPGA